MAGSEAEERLRAKAERMLRRRWPDARIIHELNIGGGSCRLDVAAVTPNFLVLVEIKSEKDDLSRLKKQYELAVKAADEVWVCCAEKHAEPAKKLGLWRAKMFVDTMPAIADADLVQQDYGAYWDKDPLLMDPRSRFQLLWAHEMRDALSRHYGGASIPTKFTMDRSLREALESMNGRELRAAVCAQLRNRSFPRADPKASETPDERPATPRLV